MHRCFKFACIVPAWALRPAGGITTSPGSSPHPVLASPRTTGLSHTTGLARTMAIRLAGITGQAPPRPPAGSGVPSWLTIMLLAVGLLAVLILAAGLLVARRHRRRRAVVPALPAPEPSRSGPDHPANFVPEASVVPASASPGPVRPARIVVADHDRLVITRSKRDGTICVLRPPGADPADILRVARLVLPEGPYGTLAEELGMPAHWASDQ